MRVWVQGTVAIDRSSIDPQTDTWIRSSLTLIRREYNGQGTPVTFFLDYNDGWLHVPRAWFYSTPQLSAFTRELHDQRSDGFPLPPGTWARVTFGEPPYPPGQPDFIRDITRVCTGRQEPAGGLAIAPTRSGKTLCSLQVACNIGKSTLVLVNDGELMKQWVSNIEEHLGVRCGIIRQDRWDRGTPFTVAMAQTLVNREMSLEDRRTWGTVIVDECDSAPCRTFWTALHRLHARHVIGLSATPDRKDGLNDAISWIVGQPIAALERDLDAEVCWVPYRWTGKKLKRRASWVEIEKELMDDYSRINSIGEMAAAWSAAGRRVLVMAGIVEHLKRIAEAATKAGGDVGLYLGSADAEERDKPICMATYKKAAKGIDFKLAPNLFIPAGPRADIRQAMGRALQPQVTVRTRILDPVDHQPGLHRWAQKREAVYLQNNFTMLNSLELV